MHALVNGSPITINPPELRSTASDALVAEPEHMSATGSSFSDTQSQFGHSPAQMSHEASASAVLIADDNVVSRGMLEAAFTECGVAVNTAADGAETVRMALGQKQYMVILVSLSLHIVNSQDVARMIKSTRNPNSTTPVVALVVHDIDHDIDITGSVFDTSMAVPPSIARVRSLLGWLRGVIVRNCNIEM